MAPHYTRSVVLNRSNKLIEICFNCAWIRYSESKLIVNPPPSHPPRCEAEEIERLKKQLQWAEWKIRALEARLRLELIAKYGPKSEKLVSGFRLRARLGFSIPSRPLWAARRYPRFWISRSSSEHERDFNPPEQYAAQRTIGFVDAVRLVRWPQIWAATLVEFRCIHLNPPKDAGMVRRQSAFPHQLRDMAVAERKIQVPTHATKNDFWFVMSPVERVIRGDRHGLSF
jgi:hypothetical protein